MRKSQQMKGGSQSINHHWEFQSAYREITWFNFFSPNVHFWSIGQKTQKKCAYDFETHIGNKQKLSLKQDFLRKTPFLSDPSPIVALSWKSLSPSSCWICWIHVIHHQTLFNLRIWLSLRKSKLVQLSKLSKSLVKIIKLKFGQDFVGVVT